MQLVDTHCHIFADEYSLDADEVIARAHAAGVGQLICVGTSAEDSAQAVDFVTARAGCYASIGLHPHEAKDGQPAFDKLTALAQKSQKIVAVGECGLDYFYSHSPKTDQRAALRFQIELALAHNLPVIFHVREAFEDFWPIFHDYPGVRGVLHSFTDSHANLAHALAAGLHIGVNGIATFAKSEAQRQLFRTIPLERLLLETDAPFLTPAPFRGKVNEPMQIRRICEFLAELRQEPAENIAAASTDNARQLFRLG